MRLLRNLGVISILTLLSRIAGLAREILTAARLGAGPIADTFFQAMTIPNTFRRVLAEGAFNAAFVPLYARELEDKDRAEADRFASEALSFMQLLEGPPAGVERVFASIGQDSRHSGVVTVLSEAASSRLFPGWSMAYARTGKGQEESTLALTTQALNAYLPDALSPELHMLFVRFNTLSAFDGLLPKDGEVRTAR